jgi:hypothetical protein
MRLTGAYWRVVTLLGGGIHVQKRTAAPFRASAVRSCPRREFRISGPQSPFNGPRERGCRSVDCLPLSAHGSILPKLNVVVQHQTSNETINHQHKGDRLAPVYFHERWNAIVEIDKALNGTQSVERIPDGCEPAFSHVVKVGNFSARCVANVDAPTRLAAVE